MVPRISRIALVPGLLAGVVLVSGCSGTLQQQGAPTEVFSEFVLADPTLASQAKSNVTISITPIGRSNTYEHPELFAFKKELLPASMRGINFDSYYQQDSGGQYWGYTFGTLTGYQVEIKNGTDHILRMKDSRIYLEVEGKDPIQASTNLGDPTLAPSRVAPSILVPASLEKRDGSLIYAVSVWELTAEQTRKHHTLFDSQFVVPIGVSSEIIHQNQSAYRLIAGADTEILPGKSLRGILLFPEATDAPSATISFYDIHTKTDAAGNPVEKSNFTFPLKRESVQAEWSKQAKRWQRAQPQAASVAR